MADHYLAHMPPDYTSPNPKPEQATRTFTDRKAFQSAFWNRYKNLDPKLQSVLSFYGLGGIGKSALLTELQKQLRDKRAMIRPGSDELGPAWGQVNFQISDELQPANALLALRNSLVESGGLTLPTFDIAYAHYYACLNFQEPPEVLRNLADRFAVKGFNREMFLPALEEIPYVDKIFKLGNVVSRNMDLRRRRTIVQNTRDLRFFLFQNDPLKMTDGLIGFFAADLRAAVESGRSAVLFFDTYEALESYGRGEYAGARTDTWVRNLAGQLPGVLTVIAGRRKLDWADRDPDWSERNLLEQHLVGELALEDARLFLESAQLPEEVISTILENYEGLPFFLDLTVDLYEEGVLNTKDPVDKTLFAGSIEEIGERLLAYLQPNERSAVKVLSATRFFDYSLFRELIQEFGTAYPVDQDSFFKLLRFSLFTTEDSNSYVHAIAQDFLAGATQKNARKYLLKKAEHTLQNTEVKDFRSELLSAAESGFFQARRLSGSEFGFQWLVKHCTPFVDSGQQGLLIDLWGQSYNDLRAILGEEHPNTLTSLSNYAQCLGSVGRAGEALPHHERALQLRRQVLGEEHPNTLTSLNNYALCLGSVGRAGEALPHYERALQLRRQVLGEEHPNTLTSLNNYAHCLESVGRAGEALPHYERALQLSRQVLGEEHPETLTSLNNYAHCLGSVGRAGEALPHHERALQLRRQVLGEDHPDTISSLNNYAQCLESVGRAGEALLHHERALQLRRQVLGEEHPNTLTSLNNYAHCLESVGRAGEALPHHERALQLRRQVLGEEHPNTLTSLNNYAYCLESVGRTGEALPHHERALQLRRQVLGEEHPNTLTSLDNYAYCLGSVGRAGEALPHHERALQLRRQVLGKEHPDTISSLNNYALCLGSVGRAGEALPHYERALQLNRQVLGEEHPNTLTSLNNYAHCLESVGRAGEALPHHERALQLNRQVLGEEHPDTLTSLNNYAHCLKSLGRAGDALPHYEKAYFLSKKTLGEEHPYTKVFCQNFLACQDQLN